MAPIPNAPEVADTVEQLRLGCEQLGLAPTAEQLDLCQRYIALLEKWNRAYNLTAVTGQAAMVTRHLLDSLSVAPYITGTRYIDVGTGAGLPGVPLAVLFPDRQFDLLDSNGKKTRFLFQVKSGLGLANIEVYHRRAESFHPQQAYDGVLSRAFASLHDMVARCGHLLRPGGELLAMKGARPDAEISAVADVCDVRALERLTVPGLAEERHLVLLAMKQDAG